MRTVLFAAWHLSTSPMRFGRGAWVAWGPSGALALARVQALVLASAHTRVQASVHTQALALASAHTQVQASAHTQALVHTQVLALALAHTQVQASVHTQALALA